MLTIFTTPKAFRGHTGIIQHNAIESWRRLSRKCEVILFGEDEGTSEAAARHGARHIPQVECNEHGTPLISAMFTAAQEIAANPLVCYVNADIMLLSDFLPALRGITQPEFLVIGQRWDIDIEEEIDFDNPYHEQQLRQRLKEKGKLHPPSGIDYFAFPRGQYKKIPPFAVGRPGWDNWMIYHTRTLTIPVIDATRAVTALHQNHDYGHHPSGRSGVFQGEEAQQNRSLIGDYSHILDTSDADWQLRPDGLHRVSPLKLFRRRIARMMWKLVRFFRGRRSL